MQASHLHTIKGLLLDLDNTLYFYEPSHKAALNHIFLLIQQKKGLSVSILLGAYEAAKQQVKHRLHATAASHHRLLYLQGMLEQLGIFSSRLAHELYQEYWKTFLSTMKPLPGVKETLPRLAHTYKIGIVTNFIADIQYLKLDRLGLSESIHTLTTSEEVGCEKPDQKIFLAACKKMQLRPEELCMVGDDLGADIIPAHQLGMDTYWVLPDSNYSQAEHSLFNPCSTFHEHEKRLL